MKALTRIVPAALIAAIVAVGGAPVAKAGLDISFGVNTPIDDDGHLFLSISSRYFDRDRPVVDNWSRRFNDPDDLSVFFWIARQSNRQPEFVYSLRRQGLPWFEVGRRCGIGVDAWYVPVGRPGPRYDRAYGYWQHHQRDPHYNVRLNDGDARDLVAVRMAHEYYGVTPEVAMGWRGNGQSTRTMMSHEYRSRHRDGDRGDNNHNDRRGQDRDDHQGNGHKHGNGNGNGHGNR